ncbi:tetratricopeptide repeat protein [Actinoplanes sp. LDG1-06]|uniref:Tetratricopeptide repeat protein n=1 Tax=Paractinoplanes ovalisporus TaxID=2810368 RepID=A0ABS2A9E4_9ACTN|nr:tetratricopeptide repeat protein [Actinoplanes ovalisporus]MBM2616453.1 tetratricopeptide repeat protein [Actinoplanes ovalisporus]
MSLMELPDPAGARSVDELVESLRLLKRWAGDPSYETLKERVNAAWTAEGRPPAELTPRSTLANAFVTGRRRLNTDLVLAIVRALHPDDGYVDAWRQALRVTAGEIEAVSQVRVQGSLPPDLADFTGRAGELDTLGVSGGAFVISAIEGMAGVGKTQLAVHAAHRLLAREPFEHVLFVNLRGFHPDPAQPPADPAAVLDGFLRLLGVPGHRVPHGLPALTEAYRQRLSRVRALIVLDNAADAGQVRPLLPHAPGVVTLITSRRRLDGLPEVTHLAVDVFTPDEAIAFLARALPDVPVGPEPLALAQIARSCGHLPLALGLIAGHIRNTPGWNLTDHADRLDERLRELRLDSGVELALELSYRHLPAAQQRVLRLAALHPGQDFDAYAMAALDGAALAATRERLDALRADHLVQEPIPGRYTLHDLVRAFATSRAHDQDRRSDRTAALTRFFDWCLATAAAAMDRLHPVEFTELRARIPEAGSPVPELGDTGSALAWLDAERPTLVAVAAHTADQGWPGHTSLLVRTLARYFGSGHQEDALTVYNHALRAARSAGDLEAQAFALTGLGDLEGQVARPDQAEDHLRQALVIFQRLDDTTGESTVLFNLGRLAEKKGNYPAAIDHKLRSLALDRAAGNKIGEVGDLAGLGATMERAGRYDESAAYYQQSLDLALETGDLWGGGYASSGLGDLALHSGDYRAAGDHLRDGLRMHRQIGNISGAGGALDSLGLMHTRLGEVDQAVACHLEALEIFRNTDDDLYQAFSLNGLGEAVRVSGRDAEALTHHTAALRLATAIGNPHQQARAEVGIGRSHQALGDTEQARFHYERALALYTDLGLPIEAAEVDARLTAVGDQPRTGAKEWREAGPSAASQGSGAP